MNTDMMKAKEEEERLRAMCDFCWVEAVPARIPPNARNRFVLPHPCRSVVPPMRITTFLGQMSQYPVSHPCLGDWPTDLNRQRPPRGDPSGVGCYIPERDADGASDEEERHLGAFTGPTTVASAIPDTKIEKGPEGRFPPQNDAGSAHSSSVERGMHRQSTNRTVDDGSRGKYALRRITK